MTRELLIFGAGGYLGKGITSSLLSKNYDKIYLFDFDISKIKTEKENVVLIDTSDLSEEDNVMNVLSKVSPGKDKILFLYSTIGGFSGGRKIWDAEIADYQKMMTINLQTSFLIAKHFSKLVKDSLAGSICFTAALTGLKEEVGKGVYGVSKAALIHLVKTLALEGKEINLSVNALAPYIIDTPANRDWMKEADYSSWIKPEEVGELVHDLFTRFNFVTGNVIKLTNRFAI
ncbi:MAG: SDR family oxidoreductase [Ignavibacteriales bacterium]|nr:MAG: SDR family oxidoreductase [Ignavibacteriales bacterium]